MNDITMRYPSQPDIKGLGYLCRVQCTCGQCGYAFERDVFNGIVKSCPTCSGQKGLFLYQPPSESYIDDLNHPTIGRRTGMALVVDVTEHNNGDVCLMRCDCGTVFEMPWVDVKRGLGKSCGCVNAEVPPYESVRARHPMKQSWVTMRAKGRKMGEGYLYEPWEDFKTFYEWAIENGWGPDKTLYRPDNTRGWSPDNARWGTVSDKTSSVEYKRRVKKEELRANDYI